MRLFGSRLNALLVMALAALLALGAISAFADSGPPEPSGDEVTVDGGDTDGDTDGDDAGDTDGDTEGDTEGDVEGDTDVDTEGDGTADIASHDGDGPNPDRGCANGSVDHAREVLTALLEREHPGENDGIQNALDKMCHGFFAEAAEGAGEEATGESPSDHGNGHAFGRGHGHGRPEAAPAGEGE